MRCKLLWKAVLNRDITGRKQYMSSGSIAQLNLYNIKINVKHMLPNILINILVGVGLKKDAFKFENTYD